jgi:hypothetical protein
MKCYQIIICQYEEIVNFVNVKFAEQRYSLVHLFLVKL